MSKCCKVCILVMNEFVYDNAMIYRAKAVAAGGYKVTVIALMDREGKLSRRENKYGIKILRINVISRRFSTSIPIKILRFFEYLIKAIPTCISQHAHIYHASGSVEMLFLGFVASQVANAYLVYDTKDFQIGIKVVRNLRDNIELSLIRVLERALIKKAHLIITSSDSIAYRLKDIYNIELPIIIRECKPFLMVEGSNKIREVLHVADDKKIVLYLGDIVECRGFDKLVEAAAYFDNALAVISGDGEYKEELIDKVIKLNLSDKVKFIDKIPFEELATYISSADLGVTLFSNDCSNNSYNIDNRLFYYIACGVPVISSNTFERKKIIEEYDMGLIVDENNPRDMAKKINDFLWDTVFYNKVKQRVIRVARNSLNLENESKKLLEAYGCICH